MSTIIVTKVLDSSTLKWQKSATSSILPILIPQKSLSSIQVRHTTSKVSPDPQFSRERTFGVPLEALTKNATQCGVPFPVTQMVEYLEVFGKLMFCLLSSLRTVHLSCNYSALPSSIFIIVLFSGTFKDAVLTAQVCMIYDCCLLLHVPS